MLNAELAAIRFLNQDTRIQAACPASGQLPPGFDGSMGGRVTVELEGARIDGFKTVFSLLVNVYADTRAQCASFCLGLVAPRLLRLGDLPEVAAVQVHNIAYYPAAGGWPRYVVGVQVSAHVNAATVAPT